MGKYASMGKKGKSEDAASLPGRRGTYHVHGGNTDAVPGSGTMGNEHGGNRMTISAGTVFSTAGKWTSSLVVAFALLSVWPLSCPAGNGQTAGPAPGGLTIPPLTDGTPGKAETPPPPRRRDVPREDIVSGTGQSFGGYIGTRHDPVRNETPRPPHWDQHQRPHRPPHWGQGQRPPRPPHWEQGQRPPRPPQWQGGGIPPSWRRESGR